ncbi:Csu type fimbrial protein [Rhodanobacter sp. BL-MT-08]
MMKPRLITTMVLLIMLIGGALTAPRTVHAQAASVTCSVTSAPTINFGTVDGLVTGATTSASIGWTCKNPSLLLAANATFCINIGNGTAGVTGTNRLMSAGTGQNLQFQIYQDSARTQIWGSPFSSVNSQPYQTSVVVPLGLTGLLPGTISGTAPLYASVPNAQIGLTAGTYISTFAGTDAEITVASNYTTTPATCGTGNASAFSFTANAVVAKTCTITAANNLNFGSTVGLLTGNVDATTTLQTQCTSNTAFQIGLDNGQHASGTARRMAGSSGDLVTYELYQDSARSIRWGNTVNTDTVTGTGNGAVQTNTVYGRVAPQTTPTPGTYSDTITVNVTY